MCKKSCGCAQVNNWEHSRRDTEGVLAIARMELAIARSTSGWLAIARKGSVWRPEFLTKMLILHIKK